MPFDGTNYPTSLPQWHGRLLRLADFIEHLGYVSLTSWQTCAIGEAIDDELFKAEGLDWHRWESVPAYAGDKSWRAVCRFFDVTKRDASRLFALSLGEVISGHRPSPQEVAQRIRAYVDRRWMAMAC